MSRIPTIPPALKLLSPKILTLKNVLARRSRSYQLLVIGGTLIVITWLPISIYLFVVEGLRNISDARQLEGIIELIFTTFASILLVAACIHALQVFFLAKENELFLLAPIPKNQFFQAKYIENCFAASWILLLLFLPILAGVGTVAHAPWYFFPLCIGYFAFIIFVLCGLAIGAVILTARIYPARRLRELFIIIALLVVVGLHFYTRSTDFVIPHVDNGNIEAFESTLLAWKKHFAIRSQDMLSLPIRFLLQKNRIGCFYIFLGLTILGRFVYAASFRIFCDFYEPTELIERWQQVKKPKNRYWYRKPPDLFYSMLQKDLHLFLRDLAQPAQLILFIAIAGITLISYRQTALLKQSLGGSELVFGDILFGLGIFSHLLMAVLFAGRFIFPALSLEAESRWLIDSAPMDISRFIRAKYQTQTLLSLCILLPIYISLALMTDIPLDRMLAGIGITSISVGGIVAIAVGSGSLLKALGGDPLVSSAGAVGSFIFMVVSLFLIPACMAVSLAIAVLCSVKIYGAIDPSGLVYCGTYATIIMVLSRYILKRAATKW